MKQLVIKFRVTEAEKKLIQEKAQKDNLTISKFILESCYNNKRISIKERQAFSTLVKNLSYISNNLNQLTKVLNNKHIYDRAILQADITSITNEISAIKAIIIDTNEFFKKVFI